MGGHVGARAEGLGTERALAREEASREARLPGPRCGPNIDCNEEQALGNFSRRGSRQGSGEIILIAGVVGGDRCDSSQENPVTEHCKPTVPQGTRKDSPQGVRAIG